MPDRPSKGRTPQGPGIQTHPTEFPQTSPPPSGDYSYTVEIVMHMQHDLGKLTEAVDGLKSRQAEQGQKLDSLDKKVYAGIVLLAVFGAILTFFAKSINDAITHVLLNPPAQQQQPINSAPQQAIPTQQPTR